MAVPCHSVSVPANLISSEGLHSCAYFSPTSPVNMILDQLVAKHIELSVFMHVLYIAIGKPAERFDVLFYRKYVQNNFSADV